MAIIQGVTELFPISSLGHSILVPALLSWPINRGADWFLPFIVMLHLGTATALFLYFRREWLQLLAGVYRGGSRQDSDEARLFWLLVLATIPAGILGLLLRHKIQALFSGYAVAATFLAANGLLLIIGDRMKNRSARHTLSSLTWPRALTIGFAQALALIPGFSRSGATLVAGLGTGLDYEASAKFSFLLATPIIAAAGLLEVPKLFHAHLGSGLLITIIAAGIVAGIFAWLATWFLMRYFHSHEVKALRPFGLYCIALGLFALAVGG